jgi:hypothetical protein
MSYLGRGLDKISNIEILDNITFDGSSSYSITKSSVAFVPNSAQSLLISIDGVVQATNFTVSTSTIDFGVAVPSTSTCNFFLHYGTGVAFIPTDGSVTEAKIGSGAVTSAKITYPLTTFSSTGIDDNATANALTIDSSSNLQFNSGFGSVATAYGCRAWVNWDGDGVSGTDIRGSGNVSSITYSGTGDYSVNLATAMPDTNYSIAGASGLSTSSYQTFFQMDLQAFGSTSVIDIAIRNENGSRINSKTISVQVFR